MPAVGGVLGGWLLRRCDAWLTALLASCSKLLARSLISWNIRPYRAVKVEKT